MTPDNGDGTAYEPFPNHVVTGEFIALHNFSVLTDEQYYDVKPNDDGTVTYTLDQDLMETFAPMFGWTSFEKFVLVLHEDRIELDAVGIMQEMDVAQTGTIRIKPHTLHSVVLPA